MEILKNSQRGCYFDLSHLGYLNVNEPINIAHFRRFHRSYCNKAKVFSFFKGDGLWEVFLGSGNKHDPVHVPNFGGCHGRRTRMGVTTVSNSLILGGWVKKF